MTQGYVIYPSGAACEKPEEAISEAMIESTFKPYHARIERCKD